MKKALTTFILASSLAAPVLAEQGNRDIIITAKGLEFSDDLKTIHLEHPTISVKHPTGDTKLEPLTSKQFVTYWNPEEKTSDFDQIEPNATLTSSDSKEGIESSFIIESADAHPNRLDLNVSYLTNAKNHTTPVLVDGQPASLQELKALRSSEATVTVLVDCIKFLDSTCH